MVQTIIYTIIVIAVFVYTVARMIKKNETSYLYILILEFLGIIINFIFIFVGKSIPVLLITAMYIISVIIPVIIIILENKGLYLGEIINIIRANRKTAESKKILLENIDKYPNSYISHKMLANYYLKNKENEKAEDEYIKAINIKPKDYETHLKLATVLHENKKDEEAVALLQSTLRAKPDFSKGSILLGNILYENEMYKEAINVYNEALKYSPAAYELYYCLGMTYTRLNDFQNAMEYYKKAATINSLKDISNLSLGQIYLIFREYEEAEKYFYEEIKSDDEKISANAYLYLAKIKLIKNDNQLAIQYANMAVELDNELIKKIENDYTLSKILGKIRIPESKKTNTKLKENDVELIDYLGKTFNVIENLTENAKQQTFDKEKEL